MAVGDRISTGHLCTRYLHHKLGCYCDSLNADVKWCQYATWEMKKHCYYGPDEQELKERHQREAPAGIPRETE